MTAMSLSIVLPAFNEEGCIEECVKRCLASGERLASALEVIVVDDGSSDETRRIVTGLSAEDPRVRTLHHAKNRGYGAALKSGLFAARHELVFFTDADLQFDIGQLAELMQHAREYGIVAGYRAPRRDPWHRRFNGWAWSRLVGMTFGLGVRDVDCAFKLFDRRIFEQIELVSLGAFVNTEILVRARAAGFSCIEVPVSHYPRMVGHQSGANVKVILRAFRELWLLWTELRGLRRSSEAPPRSAQHGDQNRGSHQN